MFHFGSSKVIWGKYPQKTTRSELSKGGEGNNVSFSVKKYTSWKDMSCLSIPRIFRLPPFARCGKVSRGQPDHRRGAIHHNYLGIHRRGRAIPQSFWSYQSPGLCWKPFRAVQFCWLLTHHLTPGTYPEQGDIYVAAHSLLEKQYEIPALTPCCWLKIQSSSVCH